MKNIYLIRHAKSSWKDFTLKDHERPLNKRGKRDAPFMAQVLKNKLGSIDLLLSSDAKRALQTAKHFKKAFFPQKKGSISQVPDLYHASESQIWDAIYTVPEKHKSILIFGHNPGFTFFTNEFSGKSYIDNVPTCGIVCLKSSAEKWSEVETTNTIREWFIYPKMYPECSE